MPAKSKFKKPVTHKTVPSVAGPLEALVSLPESVTQPVNPAPTLPPAKQDLAPPGVPTTQPVENLEQILDSASESPVADGKNRLTLGIGIVGASALIAGSIIVFLIYLGSSKTSQTVTPTAAVIPTLTPIPAFVRSTVTFEVINASGIAGAATKGANELTKIGYTVLTVGNGKKQVTSELLLAGSLSPAAVSEILADTNSLFSVSSSSGDLTGTTASARIIIGSK